MSSYWAGYSGTGLVLNRGEFTAFLSSYMEKNPVQAQDLEKHLEGDTVEEYGLEEICFLKSVHAGEDIKDLQANEDKHQDKAMYFTELTDDNIEGCRLWPFFRPDGRMNVREEKPDGYWEEAASRNPMLEPEEGSCYVIWSERDFCSPAVFERPAYGSYEEFKQEFKDSMGAYLPEGFDWDAHLGYLSYACYA